MNTLKGMELSYSIDFASFSQLLEHLKRARQRIFSVGAAMVTTGICEPHETPVPVVLCHEGEGYTSRFTAYIAWRVGETATTRSIEFRMVSVVAEGLREEFPASIEIPSDAKTLKLEWSKR